MKKGLLLPKVV